MTITLNDKIVAATLSLLAERDGDPVSPYGVVQYKPFRRDLNDDETGALRQMVDVHDTGEFKAAVDYGHKLYREADRYRELRWKPTRSLKKKSGRQTMTDTRTQRLQAELNKARKEAGEAYAVYVAARKLHNQLWDTAVRADLALENHKAIINQEVTQ